MKGLLTFIFIAFLFGQPAFGQQPEKGTKQTIGPVYGFRAGGNLSTFSSNDPFKDLYLGYHAGAFLDMYPSNKYGYSFEVNYSKQGGDFVSMHYLVAPVLFNVYASEVALQSGLYAAPLLFAENHGSLNKLDLGLAIGIKKALGDFGLGVRYYHGLRKIANAGDKGVNQKLELSVRINLQ